MAIFFTIICQFFFAEKFFALSKVENLFKFYDGGERRKGAKVANVSLDVDKSNSGGDRQEHKIVDSFKPIRTNICQRVVYALTLGYAYPASRLKRRITKIGRKKVDKTLDLVHVVK